MTHVARRIPSSSSLETRNLFRVSFAFWFICGVTTQQEDRRQIIESSRRLGLALDEAQAGRLGRFLDAVLVRNRQLNLTAARSFADALRILVRPALALGRLGLPSPRLVVDLGSGNGFPGIVVAVAWPRARVLLVERRGKKADAIADALMKSDIRNASAVRSDGRVLARQCPEVSAATDLVTVRGVGPLAPTTRVAAPWLAPGGRIVHWKAEVLDDRERAEGQRVAAALGLEVMPDTPFERGTFVVYRKPEAPA